MDQFPKRLRRCTRVALVNRRLTLLAANGFRSRLLGLIGLRGLPKATGLLLPETRSVHTLGMRFALDLVWVDGESKIVHIDAAVPANRLVNCRRARHVIELPAGGVATAQLHTGLRLM